MTGFSRCGFIFLALVVLLPVNVRAGCPMWDAEAVVTLRDGLPCFSYPRDEVIRMRPYSFGYISVTRPGPISRKDGWAAQIADPYRIGLLEPNSPESCIRYGGPHPGIVDTDPSTPFLFDTPYMIFLRVSTPEGALYERKFATFFCISHDGKGNKIIVGAYIEDDPQYIIWKCLKPGEKPKRGFWEKLFGN